MYKNEAIRIIGNKAPCVAQAVYRPLVSVVAPAYNEAAIIGKNLAVLCDYLETLEDRYRWELIVVNDGSRDETGELAEAFAENRENVRILHHIRNFGLGQALRYGFNNCRGDYVVTMDLDLSYSPDHIERLLTRIRETKAKIVIASPYARGGKVSNVPWLRKTLSVWANRFLSLISRGSLTDSFLPGNVLTLTSMVRVYDGKFLSRLNLMTMGMGISPEIIHKALILRARIEEIPAHLDWGFEKAQKADGAQQRRSSMRILKSIVSSSVSGFMFRPFLFFTLPGLLIALFSVYAFVFVFGHVADCYQTLPAAIGSVDYRLGTAIADAFARAPHAFIIAGISLIVSIQLINLGIMSLQNKRYFEEIFHLGTTIYNEIRTNGKTPEYSRCIQSSVRRTPCKGRWPIL